VNKNLLSERVFVIWLGLFLPRGCVNGFELQWGNRDLIVGH